MSKIAKATIGFMIGTLCSKLLGFFRELVLASTYGTSVYSDAYITATNIPVVIFAIIGSSIGTALIPIYFEVKRDLGEKESLKFINNITNIVLIICVFMAILGVIYSEKLVLIFAMGFNGEILDLTSKFTKIMMIGIVFSGLSYIMSSYLQIRNKFIVTGFISVPKNIIIIICIIFSAKYNPNIMIWGTLIGISTEFLFQLPFAIKNEYRYQLYINFKDKYVKKMVWLIGPVLIGVAVNQINTMVDRSLASTLVEGSISALNYANKLNGFIMALFITSVGSVIYPNLSKLSLDKNLDKFIDFVVNAINIIIILIIPISIGAIVLSTPIVKLLFQRGQFDSKATSMTSIALTMYSIGMIAFGLRDILGKVFYSLKDTKTPMINGVLAMSMNIIFNIVLVKHLQIMGLALSTSLSAIICIVLLFFSLKKKIGYFGQDRILKTALKSIAASFIMGIITAIIYNLLLNILGNTFVSEFISLLGSICVGSISYLVFIVIFKIEEVNLICSVIKKKIKI